MQRRSGVIEGLRIETDEAQEVCDDIHHDIERMRGRHVVHKVMSSPSDIQFA